jgi:hypothetical protein
MSILTRKWRHYLKGENENTLLGLVLSTVINIKNKPVDDDAVN